jgi:predicted AlkP superfamily pyrophosphatase or phosphodiesterase
MSRFAAVLGISLCLLAIPHAQAPAIAPPKLLVLVVVDQMRWDYLEYYKDKIHLGFDRLVRGGAVFSEARYPYAKTETAQGHTMMATGQPPSVSGITGDSWYDRLTKTTITAGESNVHKLVGTTAAGGSPEQLLVHTVGDMMKLRDPATLVMTASWKRYSAELTGGHHADAAYWFDAGTGHMVTSDYYLRDYPDWVKAFDKTDLTAPYFGKDWLTHKLGAAGGVPDDRFRNQVRDTPLANDILLAFAKRMLTSTALGRDGVTDFMVVSFSALDYVGHTYGAHTPEVAAAFVEQDRQLGEFLDALDHAVGKDNWTLALTADHGVALPADQVRAQGGDAGAINTTTYRAEIRKALAAKFPDPDKLIATTTGAEIYLDYAEAASRGIDGSALEDAVAAAARAQPGVAQAYTRRQILGAAGTSDPFLKMIALGYFPSRSGDIYVLVKPNYYFGSPHGAPYEYDLHVPLIFYGHGIAPGRYDRKVLTFDLAPTLAEIAGVKLPAVPGKPLTEAFKKE